MVYIYIYIYRYNTTKISPTQIIIIVKNMKDTKKSIDNNNNIINTNIKDVELNIVNNPIVNNNNQDANMNFATRIKRGRSRNSWDTSKKFTNRTQPRKSFYIYGIEESVSIDLYRRVKYGQLGAAICGVLVMIFYILYNAFGRNNIIFGILTAVFTGFALLFAVMIYYKNVSFVIAKRLLKEINVSVILLLAICDAVIEIFRPNHSFSNIFWVIYLSMTIAIIFMDSIKVKSRIFAMVCCSIYVLVNIYNMYGYTFGISNLNVKLFTYTINGEELIIWKRSVKRAIRCQVLFFIESIGLPAFGIWHVRQRY